MIKRRFYKLEHGDRDAPSESSSSDFELQPEDTEESSGEEEEVDEEQGDEEEQGNDNKGEIKVREKNQSHLSSSGYESENSSANEVNLDSSGLPTSDDDAGMEHGREIAMGGHLPGKGNGESVDMSQSTTSKDGELPSNLPDCVVKCKSVFKCRLCPRIVCLSEETLRDHLTSKRHARSEKLLKEGRLKLMLNDDGKVEGETPKKQDSSEEDEAAPYSVKNQKGKKRNRFSKRPLNRKKGGNHARFSRRDSTKRRHI